MKIACIQMHVRAAAPETNFARAKTLIQRAAKQKPDVILLPELWNTGFAPERIDPALADAEGTRTKAFCGGLAKEHGVNLLAGSVLTRKKGSLCNTAYAFDRAGNRIAEYDKTHLFSPMGEGRAYTAGDQILTFPLDGVVCGVMICYDLRFPELARAMALSGAKLLLIPAEWPKTRTRQMLALLSARAIENQAFAAICNGCGDAFGTRYGGRSAVVDPLGNVIAKAGRSERILTAEIDWETQERIRTTLPVFSDRRPELYSGLCEANRR